MKTMLFFNKYLRRPPELNGTEKEAPKQEQGGSKKEIMLSPCIREISEACSYGCLPAAIFGGQTASGNTRCYATTARDSRSNFVKTTTSSLFQNTFFTNHEALPALPDAFASFLAVYPCLYDTQQIDRIRDEEYNHLSNHVCLDYIGISLFSYAQMHSSIASTSSDPSSSCSFLQPPYFSISYKSASLKSQVQSGNEENGLTSAIRKRIMNLFNISDDEYSMVCTANMTTAFKLLAESYPFDAKKRLLSVYDHESEAMNAMAESARKRGAKVISARFKWPSMRIHSARLTEKLSKQKKRRKGLFVFPLQSRMTGARYPYLWMTVAQENGWQVVLDACALGPKDMDTFGLSLIQPDFIICSFFKVLGDDPSGFAGLFIKRSSTSVLASSTIARSIGIVSLVPESQMEDNDVDNTSSFSGPVPTEYCISSSEKVKTTVESTSNRKEKQVVRSEEAETSKEREYAKRETSSEIVQVEHTSSVQIEKMTTVPGEVNKNMEIECRGLDQADSLGLLLISNRLRCISNWLVLALMKLRHPHSENGHSLVRIYGPRVKFDRGHALAFNVFDWKGEKVDPAIVQKLADRSNISLSCGFLQNIILGDKLEAEKDEVLERRVSEATVVAGRQRKESFDLGINVVSVSLSFLTNFKDAYKLWTFIAKFLDADFVEKERWRYVALNQKMIEV